MKGKMASGRPLDIEKLKKWMIRWPFPARTTKNVENSNAEQNAE
jgi:hypothetical protein